MFRQLLATVFALFIVIIILSNCSVNKQSIKTDKTIQTIPENTSIIALSLLSIILFNIKR